MEREQKARVKEWLEKGEIDVFLGYRMFQGHPLPYCFHPGRAHEIQGLTEGTARYPLVKIALGMARREPDIRIGLLGRDCDRRALKILAVWNQIDPNRFRTLDLNCCPSPLKTQAECSYLSPVNSGFLKGLAGVENSLDLDEVEGWGREERFVRWMHEFQKCIKCYGCRNICPVCFCSECSLEHPDFIGTGDLPPEVPLFHLARAVHMAGRCIDCGLCEEACPVDIPLRLLYRKANEIMKRVFDYAAGTDDDKPPFSALEEKVTLEPRKIDVAQGEGR